MKQTSQLMPFLKPLLNLQELFLRSKCNGIIIGGIAGNFLGKPRFTADIDAVILLDDEKIPKFLDLAKRSGFIPRIKNVADFALKNRVLLLKHKSSMINIDISLGLLPFEKEAIERSIPIKIGSLTFRIPTPEDFIIFKAVAHRKKDILDIQETISNYPKLDKKRVKKIVLEFAEVLEMPEIWNDIKELFNRIK